MFESLTGAAQRGDVWKGVGEGTDLLKSYTNAANQNLRSGYGGANQVLQSGMAQGNSALSRGNMQARGDINRGTNAAMGQLRGANDRLQPYYSQGTQANTMYGNALGINGGEARAQTQGVYMDDPIMQALMNQSNENVLKRYNASGLANSGVSRAAILQNQYANYGNWLDRLNGQGQQGFAAAGQMGQNNTNMAQIEQQRGNALSGLAQQLGQNTADNTYRYTQPMAGNRVDLGRGIAQNALNLGQARAGLTTDARAASANTRGMGWQNALSLLGSGVNAATGITSIGGGGGSAWNTNPSTFANFSGQRTAGEKLPWA